MSGLPTSARARKLPPELTVFHDDEHATIATWQSVLISVWRQDVGVQDVAKTEPAQAHLMARYPSLGSLAIAERKALRMSSEAQHEAARIARIGFGHCRGIALVIGVSGFTGAAIRAAVTAVHLISRTTTPQQAFQYVDPAARWLLERLEVTDEREIARLSGMVSLLQAGPTVELLDPPGTDTPRPRP